MKYSFSCAMHSAQFSVEAKNDAEAVKKLAVEARKHMRAAHSTDAPMTDAEIEKMLRAGWEKG